MDIFKKGLNLKKYDAFLFNNKGLLFKLNISAYVFYGKLNYYRMGH